jgi:hypothetical protein
MNDHDPVTGEILADDDTRGGGAVSVLAADNKPVAKRSGYMSDVLRMLEDGQFNADVSEAMRGLAAALEAHAHNNKGQAKGRLSLTFDFHLANGVLVITPNHTVKKPVQKRIGTALFVGEDGSLGRNPPGQRPMFGAQAPRDPYEAREVRDA